MPKASKLTKDNIAPIREAARRREQLREEAIEEASWHLVDED